MTHFIEERFRDNSMGTAAEFPSYSMHVIPLNKEDKLQIYLSTECWHRTTGIYADQHLKYI